MKQYANALCGAVYLLAEVHTDLTLPQIFLVHFKYSDLLLHSSPFLLKEPGYFCTGV